MRPPVSNAMTQWHPLMPLIVSPGGMGDVRPLLLVDVDGPLHPFAANAPPPGFVEYRWRRAWRRRTVRRAWLNPAHGAALLDLARCTGAELAWVSSWEHEANTTVGPALGLPALPVVGVRAYDGHPDWKFGAVGRYAYGRPLAWLDDDFDLFPRARQAFLTRRTMTTALIPVDPATGITTDHLAAVAAALRPHPS
jgi:hypothetical protein